MNSTFRAIMVAAACSTALSARAAPSKLPLDRGMYAESRASCDVHGSYDEYDAQLGFWGDELNDSVTERAIKSVRRDGDGYDLRLHVTQGEGLGGGGAPEDVRWRVAVADPRHFVLRGRDHGRDWSGSYRYCGPRPGEVTETRPAPVDASKTVATSPVPARDNDVVPDEATYVHNGSYVKVLPSRGLVAYLGEPAASMKGLAGANDVLFEGTITPKGSSGTAYLFKRGCPRMAFHAEGTGYRSGEAIVLRGEAGVRTGTECVPSTDAKRAVVLRFEPGGGFGEPEYGGR